MLEDSILKQELWVGTFAGDDRSIRLSTSSLSFRMRSQRSRLAVMSACGIAWNPCRTVDHAGPMELDVWVEATKFENGDEPRAGDQGALKPPSPAPRQSKGLPFESQDILFRAVIAVPKAEIDRREREWRKAHGKKSIAVRKVAKRRAAGLCGGCGKHPCECRRGARKQKSAVVQSPDLPRKR